MLYPFLTAPDGTELSYSEVLNKDTCPEVRVYIEKWDDERVAFDSIEIYLPTGRITKCEGFSEKEAKRNIRHVMDLKKIIWDAAKEEDGQ